MPPAGLWVKPAGFLSHHLGNLFYNRYDVFVSVFSETVTWSKEEKKTVHKIKPSREAPADGRWVGCAERKCWRRVTLWVPGQEDG
jgi:hypothetical protein